MGVRVPPEVPFFKGCLMRTVGVVVGRFQVPSLHNGHFHLLNKVVSENDELLVFLGTVDANPTPEDPLPWEVRAAMIKQAYPKAHCFPLLDCPSDVLWSAHLDSTISTLFWKHKITLYGSRDSFIPHYSGSFPVVEVEPIESFSGTEVRLASFEFPINEDFRRGLIFAQTNRYPISYQTVDVGIVKKNQILLGSKYSDNGRYRFVGGFVDAKDVALEAAAKREALEECGNIEISTPRYLTSIRVHDHRYRKSVDQVMTALFVADYIYGKPTAKDDIVDLQWFDSNVVMDVIVDNHRVLASMFLNMVMKNVG